MLHWEKPLVYNKKTQVNLLKSGAALDYGTVYVGSG